MSFFEKKEPLNIPFPTMGGEYCWNELESNGEYRLQQHFIDTNHCRILDSNNIRVAWGNEGQMRAKFRELTNPRGIVAPRYGDVIGVHRLAGLYDHYGVYENDSCIYEYAAQDQDFGDPEIHTTTLERFLSGAKNCFVLEFPALYGQPGKVTVKSDGFSDTGRALRVFTTGDSLLESLVMSDEYHLYSPEQTIQRAKSRLGEKNYNLSMNNCEHYAIWCKTGIRDSHQVNALIPWLPRYLFGNQ